MKVIKYKAFLILFLAVALNNSNAQIKSITGTVIDSASKGIILGAEIFIYSKADGKTISSTTSDIDGQFTFKNINEMNISIKLSYIGFKDKYIDTIKISDNIDLGKIMISSVPITGFFRCFQIKDPVKYWLLTFKNISEKKILVITQTNRSNKNNIDTIKSNVFGKNISVLYVLDNKGLLSVDPATKKIGIRGYDLVNIKIDGKTTAMAADELLSQMPAFNVDKVEISIVSSTKNDPEDEVGIINIVTRKNASVK